MYLSDDMTPEELADAAAEARWAQQQRFIQRRESGLLVPSGFKPQGPWAVPTTS